MWVNFNESSRHVRMATSIKGVLGDQPASIIPLVKLKLLADVASAHRDSGEIMPHSFLEYRLPYPEAIQLFRLV